MDGSLRFSRIGGDLNLGGGERSTDASKGREKTNCGEIIKLQNGRVASREFVNGTQAIRLELGG